MLNTFKYLYSSAMNYIIGLTNNRRELIMQVIDPVDEDDDSFELVEIVQSSTMLLVPINLKVETEKATSMHWSFYSEPYVRETFGLFHMNNSRYIAFLYIKLYAKDTYSCFAGLIC